MFLFNNKKMKNAYKVFILSYASWNMIVNKCCQRMQKKPKYKQIIFKLIAHYPSLVARDDRSDAEWSESVWIRKVQLRSR